MKKYGIMAAVFAAGLLLIGIGSGVAFAEYSSFTYGGKKVLSDRPMETERIEKERLMDGPFRLEAWYQDMDIIVDETIPDQQIVFEFEYDPEYTKPRVRQEIRPYDGDWEEMDDTEMSDVSESALTDGEEQDNTGMTDEESESDFADGQKQGDTEVSDMEEPSPSEGDVRKKKTVTEPEIFYVFEERRNGTEAMWRIKDEVLQSIRDRRIYDYEINESGKIKVYMSSATKEKMRW